MNIDLQQRKCEQAMETRTLRRGFTLVELLVVISIIGILMAIVVGAIRGANQDTLVAKTRGTIAKIDSILNDRYDEYLSEPLKYTIPSTTDAFPLDPSNFRTTFPVTNSRVIALPNTPAVSVLRERVRLASTRDLMRMEMPDCPADLVALSNGAFIPRPGATIATGFQSPVNFPLYMQLERTARFGRILQRVNLAANWARENANAELLYLIVEDSTLNGTSAIEAFGNSEIADTDGDGLFEFIDAWGVPIRWIRCPAGINSTARFDPDPLNPSGTLPSDPFDPTNADVGFDPANIGVALAPPGAGQRPLVLSAGVDGRFGIRFFGVDPLTSISTPYFSTSAITLNNSLPTIPRPPAYASALFVWPDPFAPRDFLRNGVDMRLGGVLDDPTIANSVDPVADPIGVQYVGNTATLIPNPESDTRFRLHAQDNVTNLDESGASL